MLSEIALLRRQFSCRDIRDGSGGPDLAVWMRIARPHHSSAIFKNLHVVDLRHGAQFLKLRLPRRESTSSMSFNLHARQSEIMAWRKTDDPANSGLAFGDEQVFGFSTSRLSRAVSGLRSQNHCRKQTCC